MIFPLTHVIVIFLTGAVTTAGVAVAEGDGVAAAATVGEVFGVGVGVGVGVGSGGISNLTFIFGAE